MQPPNNPPSLPTWRKAFQAIVNAVRERDAATLLSVWAIAAVGLAVAQGEPRVPPELVMVSTLLLAVVLRSLCGPSSLSWLAAAVPVIASAALLSPTLSGLLWTATLTLAVFTTGHPQSAASKSGDATVWPDAATDSDLRLPTSSEVSTGSVTAAPFESLEGDVGFPEGAVVSRMERVRSADGEMVCGTIAIAGSPRRQTHSIVWSPPLPSVPTATAETGGGTVQVEELTEFGMRLSIRGVESPDIVEYVVQCEANGLTGLDAA